MKKRESEELNKTCSVRSEYLDAKVQLYERTRVHTVTFRVKFLFVREQDRGKTLYFRN